MDANMKMRAWHRAAEASKIAALDAFSELENPISELINMSFILDKMICALEAPGCRPVKLEATENEWNAVCFAASKLNEMANGLNDRYLAGHNLACDYERKFIKAHMAEADKDEGKSDED